jgi:hypothetical protein
MGLGHFPKLTTTIVIKAADKAVSPTRENCIIVFGHVAAHTAGHFGRHHGHLALILREVPDFEGATFVDRSEHVAVVSKRNVIDASVVSIRVQHEAQVSGEDAVHLSRDCANDHLLFVVAEIDVHHFAVKLRLMTERPLTHRNVDLFDFAIAPAHEQVVRAERRRMNTVGRDWHAGPVDLIVDREDANFTGGCARQEQISTHLGEVVVAV